MNNVCIFYFLQENCGFPDRVIVWRDGVGDGQLSFTKEHEVPQVSKALQMLNINAKCTFCVVQKRINARIFAKVTVIIHIMLNLKSV